MGKKKNKKNKKDKKGKKGKKGKKSQQEPVSAAEATVTPSSAPQPSSPRPNKR